MKDVLLMNPNCNPDTTEAMCAIAAKALKRPPLRWTAPSGPMLISTPDALSASAVLVEAAPLDQDLAAVIVSAFGDPGAEALARRLTSPVIGIGAASARAASAKKAPFAVATTTPALQGSIDTLMRQNGDPALYLGCFFADGDPDSLMQSEASLDQGLLQAISTACQAGAESIIIGGGPLGTAAERLRRRTRARLFNPVLCAAKEVAALLEAD